MYFNVGYPQYNNTERDLGTITRAFIEKPIEDSFRSRMLTLPRFQILPYLNHAFNDTLTYIAKKLELLETSYKELAERLKEFIEGKFLKRIYNILIKHIFIY